ncbi:hypothetical protein HQ520_16585 [bacterium]|nr:hypothetical protein [bacterium]
MQKHELAGIVRVDDSGQKLTAHSFRHTSVAVIDISPFLAPREVKIEGK